VLFLGEKYLFSFFGICIFKFIHTPFSFFKNCPQCSSVLRVEITLYGRSRLLLQDMPELYLCQIKYYRKETLKPKKDILLHKLKKVSHIYEYNIRKTLHQFTVCQCVPDL